MPHYPVSYHKSAWQNTNLGLHYSEFATLFYIQHGNSHSVFTEILATWKSIYVATDTVDVEISCHPVHIVAETDMTT